MVRKPAILASVTLVAVQLVSVLTSCGSSEPSRAPSQPSASTAAPTPASSPAASSTGASAKPAGAGVQAYQRAEDNWAKVLEAARRETDAIVYATNEPGYLAILMQEFNKIDSKIQIKLLRLQGASGTERLKAEQSTKQYIGSGYFGGSQTTRLLDDQGMVQTVDDLPNLYAPGDVWITSPFLDKPHNTLTYAFATYYLVLNTNLVPAGQEPKTWRALGDPQWKDKLVLWEPRNSSFSRSTLALLYTLPNYGPDVVRKIVENSRVSPDSNEMARSVAKGEAAVGMITYSTFQSIKDAPVKTWTPEDGVIAGAAQMVMMKNAPAPNTTRVFFNWMLSKEGQTVLASPGLGAAVMRKDVDEAVPGTSLKGKPLLPGVPLGWDFELKQMNEAGAVFGKWYDELGK